MRTNEEIIKTLENIESLLRSINYQLKKPLNIYLSRGKELQNTIDTTKKIQESLKNPCHKFFFFD